MQKRPEPRPRPVYPLDRAKELVKTDDWTPVKSALKDATSLGFSDTEIGEVILDLQVINFKHAVPENCHNEGNKKW